MFLSLPDIVSIGAVIDTYFDHYQSLKCKVMYQKKQDAKYYVVDIIVKYGAELIKERATFKKKITLVNLNCNNFNNKQIIIFL